MKIALTTRLKVAFFIFIAVEFIGTAGIFLLEGDNLKVLRAGYQNPAGSVWDTLVDAFWVTTGLITGLGAEGFVPASRTSKLFGSFLAIIGPSTVVGAIVYIFGPIFYELIKEVSGLSVKVSSLSKHAIICGYNTVAEAIIFDFEKAKVPYIVITNQESEVEHLIDKGIPAILGDAAKSEILNYVKIKDAAVLLAVDDEDDQNALIVLTARHMRKNIPIIGKVEHHENIGKLVNAGANEVVCPVTLGSEKLVETARSFFEGKKMTLAEKIIKKKVPTLELKLPLLKRKVSK